MRIFKAVMLFILVCLIPNITAAQDATTTIEFKNADAASQLVQNYINALQKADINAMNSMLSKDAMIYGLGGGQDSLNVNQHREYFTNSTNQYKHTITRDLYLPVKVENNWNEGEWVLAWGINTITVKATKQTIEIPYHTASLVANSKIERLYYYYDMLNIMEKQGFTVTAPKKK